MSGAFIYDEATRARVAFMLYRALPLYYRVQDEPPQGTGELARFLRVLAAPLATVRQSIDELHANLFIDTCGNAALPLLADIVGTELVFPDADTNRRDLRGTVSRRQRKGTRRMLLELARDLTEQIVALVEGWQRLVLSQDLNLQRNDRKCSDVRPLTFGTSASGPLDAAHHLVDIRSISTSTGRYHPRHLTQWVSVTRMYPLGDGTAAFLADPDEPDPPDPIVPQPTSELREWRYAVHPLGGVWPLRQRPASDDDSVKTDRIYADHFAAYPGDFFGREGRFEVRIAGLAGGVALPSTSQRDPSNRLVDLEIARGAVTIELLERPLRGWMNGQFELAVCTVPVVGTTPQTAGVPDLRATIALGDAASVTVHTAEPNSAAVVMLRLRRIGGAGGFFSGATVAITGGLPSAARAHPTLAQYGFLVGALIVKLPPTWVFGYRWFYVAADGSLFEAQTNGLGEVDIAFFLLSDVRCVSPELLRTVGPGAAFPSLPRASGLEVLKAMPPPPGRGPNILHGGRVLGATGGPLAAAVQSSLVFAARYFNQGFQHELIGRLSWSGTDPSDSRWDLLDNTGEPLLDASSIANRLRALVAFRNAGPNQLAIVVRFECAEYGAIFTPAEVVWSSDDGDAGLHYLPECTAKDPNGEVWAPTLAFVSDPVQLHADGSSRDTNGGLLRMAEGSVAPLRQPVLHLRRRVHWRSLLDDSPVLEVEALRRASRCLAVDVEQGRFSLYGEAPQPWPLGPQQAIPSDFVRPPNVTVAFEDAYTGHVGAHPSPREVLLSELLSDQRELPKPTRLVARSGVLSSSLDPEVYGTLGDVTTVPPVTNTPPIPIYSSVNAALDAIAHEPHSSNEEIVRIEDDATYPSEMLIWPTGIQSLTILAADARRPVLELVAANAASSAAYQQLTLRGIAFGGVPITLPSCDTVDIQFCTVTDSTSQIVVPLNGDGPCRILRSVVAGLQIDGGLLQVVDSVVDAGTTGSAIVSQGPRVEIEGATIVGSTDVFALTASHCIFTGTVHVEDRFQGCVRYSAVPIGSVLPRRYEVFEGLEPRFLSLDRHNPGHLRLTEQSPSALASGGENGSELGAFHHLLAAQRLEAFQRRLTESIPAGLVWALLRVN